MTAKVMSGSTQQNQGWDEDLQVPVPYRHLCTVEDPWRPGIHINRAIHPEAVSTGTCDDGCCDDYRCPICGVEWRKENPD